MDLVKAYNIIPGVMVMATMRWMGVMKVELRLVEGMYNGTKGRVFVGPQMSEKFSVNIGLRKGSSHSPFMFIMVMELVSRRVNVNGILGRMLYADGLAIVAESRREMQKVGIWETGS